LFVLFDFLWRKNQAICTFHNHKKAVSTWTHAEHVKKNDYLTLKQALKNVEIPKRNATLKQLCGILKTVLLT
jgi:hypothetical protein